MAHERCRFRHPPQGAMVIWELTRHCNLACNHCCTDSSPDVSREGDLSGAQVTQAIGEMTDAGVSEFFFSGGEPLIREDFADIIAAIDPMRAEAFVNTNGYYLTAGLAERLTGTALERVTISIDGATRDIHALLRGKPSSYDRAVQAVSTCLSAGLAVRVSHVAAKPNLHGVEEFVQQMIDLGVTNIVVNTAFPVGRAERHQEILLEAHEVDDLESRLTVLHRECQDLGVELDFSLGAPATDDAPEGCPAGKRVLYVSANGDVSGCSWLYKLDPERFRNGSLQQEGFADMAGRLDALNATFAYEVGCPLPSLGAG